MKTRIILIVTFLMSVLSIQSQNKASVPNNVTVSRSAALNVVLNNIETPDSFNFYVSETASMINSRKKLYHLLFQAMFQRKNILYPKEFKPMIFRFQT